MINTILGRGDIGGFVSFGEQDDELTCHDKEFIINRICGLLGGRAGEKVMCSNSTPGVWNDFEKATELAFCLVTKWVLDDIFGPFSTLPFQSNNSTYLLSETMRSEIDNRVKEILNYCLIKAEEIIDRNHEIANKLIHKLLEKETLLEPELDKFWVNNPLSRSMGALEGELIDNM